MSAAKRAFAGALALAALTICLTAGATAASADPTVTVPSGFQTRVAYSHLEWPTNFRFTAAGGAYVAQKNGEIKYFPPGSNASTVPTTVADLRKQTYDSNDRGLLGLAIDPDFEAGQPYLYALYTFDHELGQPMDAAHYPKYGKAPNYEGEGCPTESTGCVVSGRLMRLKIDTAGAAPVATEEKLLIEDWCQQYLSHSQGDLQFGPEGALYVSSGDGASYETTDYGQLGNPCGDPSKQGGSLRAQSVLRPAGSPVSLDGTLLRVNAETGKGWPGNPFAGSGNENAERIAAFGFRNPFRFTIDSQTGEAYVDNVGNNEFEEIDRFPIGSVGAYNSGWPCFEGDGPNQAFKIIELGVCESLYDSPGSTSTPFYKYSHFAPITPGEDCVQDFGSAISGSAFYEGTSYPSEYHRAFFFSDSVRGCIYMLPADAEGEPDPSKASVFLSEQDASSGWSIYPGIDIEQGPNGNLYYINAVWGTIKEVFYDTEAPKPLLTADPEFGPAPLTVHFDASGSVAAGSQGLEYKWDLDGDGQFDDGTGATAQFEYTDGSKNVEAAVQIKDKQTGKTAVAHKTVYPGDEPPVVTIETPVQEGQTWGVEDPLHFKGSATKFGGGKLPASNLTWETRLLHCPFDPDHCHEHPLRTIRGVESGEFPAPNHDFPSYVHFFLKATDARGLSSEAAPVKIAARGVTLHLASSPSGIPIGVALKTPQATPFDVSVIEKSPTTISAPGTAVVAGVEYRFRSWSDGGAQSHVIPATSSETLTAEYEAIDRGSGDGSGGSAAGGSQGSAGGGQSQPNGDGPSVGPARPKLGAHPAKQTSSSVARFAFGADGGRYQCKIDRRKWVSCGSSRTYRGLRPGRHTFRVRALDAEGAPLTAATVFSWRIEPGRARANRSRHVGESGARAAGARREVGLFLCHLPGAAALRL